MMNFVMNHESVAHGIQLAVAPVFLLSAVAALIGAVAGRLARIIDRARDLEDRLETNTARRPHEAIVELQQLRTRGWLANACIALLTLCGILIGITIVLLFLGEATLLQPLRVAIVSFLLGISSFVVALLCFLAETFLATRILRFGRRIPIDNAARPVPTSRE